jgi:hypothetical protein
MIRLEYEMTYTETVDGPLGPTTGWPLGERAALAGHHRDTARTADRWIDATLAMPVTYAGRYAWRSRLGNRRFGGGPDRSCELFGRERLGEEAAGGGYVLRSERCFGLGRHVEHPRARAVLHDGDGDPSTVGSDQRKICQQKVDGPRRLAKKCQGLLCVVGFQDLVAGIGEVQPDDRADIVFVFDEKHPQAAGRSRLAGRSALVWLRRRCRELDDECAALRGARGDRDRAVGLFDDPQCDGAPETGSLPISLVAKKGSKIRLRSSSDMPQPVSLIEMLTVSPSRGARSRATLARTLSCPPSGIASRALSARAMSARVQLLAIRQDQRAV